MSKYCRSCGAANADSAGFCSRCGQPLQTPAMGGAGPVVPPNAMAGSKRNKPKAGIIAVIVIILIIIAAFLIFKHKNRIVGTWEGPKSDEMTFTSDGNWYVHSWHDNDDDYGTYKLSGNTLKIYDSNGDYEEFEIELSDSVMTIKNAYEDEYGMQQIRTNVWRKVN